MKLRFWFLLLVLPSCAPSGQGLLMGYKGEGLEETQLERHCDLEDAAACLLKGEQLIPTHRLPISQGIAPPGRAVFSVLMAQDIQIKLFIFDRQERAKLTALAPSRVHSRSFSPYRVEQVEATGLVPGREYELIVVDSLGTLLDHRRFQTLPERLNPLRIALVSGSDDASPAQSSAWQKLAARDPHLILALGDNVYAAKAGPASREAIWTRHVETRSRLDLFRLPKLIPILATWDDQDVGREHANLDSPGIDAAREDMDAFFPYRSDTKTVLDGPGVAKGLRVSGQTFLLLDNRSFRTTDARPAPCARTAHAACRRSFSADSGDASHFGRVQEDWAFMRLREADGPVWLLSGDQWFGAHHPFDSFAGNHPRRFARFLENLEKQLRLAARKGHRPGVVFASGGRGFSELARVRPFRGYETFELTSSPIHAAGTSAREFSRPQSLAFADGGPTYVMVSASVSGQGGLEAGAEAYRGDEIVFEKKFQVRPLKPAAKPGLSRDSLPRSARSG